jgi:hypothetical protein
MVLLISALSRVSIMLVLNRLFLHVLKALALIISMCNLHVSFVSKITPRYFTLFTNGISRPFSVGWDCEQSKSPESYLHLF